MILGNGQNISSAVMQQRKEPHDSLDFFPTPPWATRALCEFLLRFGFDLNDQMVWEPDCGRGDMARPLEEYFRHVQASDIHKYGYGKQHYFLLPRPSPLALPDWIITNPPFRLAEQFISRACINGYSCRTRPRLLPNLSSVFRCSRGGCPKQDRRRHHMLG